LQRLALLPANVLVTDISSEWLRYATPLVLAQDLAPARQLIVSVAPSESAVYEEHSSETLRTTITEGLGGIELAANLATVASQKSRNNVSTRAQPFHIIAGLNELAKEIDGHATLFSTNSDHALELLVAGLTTADPQAKVARLRAAIQADPSFGLAHIALVEALVTSKSPEAIAALRDGEAHRDSFTRLDKTRFNLFASQLSRAPLRQQIQAATAVIQIDPNNADALGTLGSNLFLAGDAVQAQQALGRAVAISPDNATLRHQLAVGLVEARQYGQAEKMFGSLGPNPTVLAETASCVLLAGDTARATSVFNKFLASVGNPDAKVLFRASWQALTGDRSGAIQQLSNRQMADPRARELAVSQIVIWQLMDKQFDAARRTAAAQPTAPMALTLAARPASATEWTTRINGLAGTNEQTKQLLSAYGLYLYGFYAESAKAWTAIRDQSGDTDLRARAMLAASLKAAGQTPEAAKVGVLPFLPEPGDLYSALSFGEMRKLIGG
jgi:Tfp pilus assembly protein PilF